MTNIEKIVFDAKYSVRFLNGKIVISGFNHIDSIHLDETNHKFKTILEEIVYYDEEDWYLFAKQFNNGEI